MDEPPEAQVAQLVPVVAGDGGGGGVGVAEPLVLIDEDGAGGGLGQGAEAGLALAQGVGGAPPVESGGHVLRHEGEDVAVLLRVARRLRVALHHEHAEGAVTAHEGHAQPVHGRRAHHLDLARGHEALEHGGRGQQGRARAQHVFGERLAFLDLGRLRVHLVHEVLERQRVPAFVLEGEVEVPRVHQLAHDLVDAGVEARHVLHGAADLRDAVEGALEPLRALAGGDVAHDDLDRRPALVGEGHGLPFHLDRGAVHAQQLLLHEGHGVAAAQGLHARAHDGPVSPDARG